MANLSVMCPNRCQPCLRAKHLTGRSSIPETAVIEPRGRGVLDSPLSRGMTVTIGGRRRCLTSVIASAALLRCGCRAGAHVSAFYSPHCTVSLSGSRLCAATLARCSASGTRETSQQPRSTPASPPRRCRQRAVGVALPVGCGRLRRPERVGVADRLGDRGGVCLASVVAVARGGGLDGGGGDQGDAENGKGLSHRCFSGGGDSGCEKNVACVRGRG